MQPLVAERGALQHAEPVLLVDDHEAERVEPHGLLHERVRADDEVDLAGRDRLAQAAPLARGHAAREQRHAESRGGQEPLHGREVLLGQDLGGRHERHLLTVLHGEHRGEHRDDGLPRAHVALQQPVHGKRPLHVVADVLERGALSGGQAERQHGAERVANAIVHARDECFALGFRLALPQQQAHLEAEELLEDQPPLGRGAIGVERVEGRAARREVHLLDGGAAIGKREARPQLGRQRIVERRTAGVRAPPRPAAAASSA